MAAVETLEIFREIQALVSDQLKVVSYKWLSRNFSVSSNYAKRLLDKFVEKHRNELKVVYSVSGWLKNTSQTYCIKLATEINLAGTTEIVAILDALYAGCVIEEVKQEFKDNCSVQVYSVQSCIPNDLALLWSAEFLQAEELFSQPLVTENCLRDNRYSGVSNSFVNRTIDGKASVISQTNNTSASSKPKASPLMQSSEKNAVESSLKINAGGKDEKSHFVSNQLTKLNVVKESKPVSHANKKKDINDSTSGGGSLASLWGRAPVKSKSSSPAIDIDASKIDSAEAQIQQNEATDLLSSGDEEVYVKCKPPSNGSNNRKRRVVMDDSDDEEEAAVNLASPDPPSAKPGYELSNAAKLVDNKNIMVGNCTENQVDIKQDNVKESIVGISQDDKKDKFNNNITGISLQKKALTNIPKPVDAEIKKENGTTDAGSTIPKRRKLLKTRIDERGREVTEVVWEGEAVDSNADKTVASNDISSRPAADNKMLGTNTSTNSSDKAGNKKPAKGGGKNAKQGNILSFFKKV